MLHGLFTDIVIHDECCNSLFNPLHYFAVRTRARILVAALEGLPVPEDDKFCCTFSVTPCTCEDKDEAGDESSQHTESPCSYLFSPLFARYSSCCRAARRARERNEKRSENAENSHKSRVNYRRKITSLSCRLAAHVIIKIERVYRDGGALARTCKRA